MGRTPNQIAEEIEKLQWELADAVTLARGLTPVKREWAIGEKAWCRDMDGVYPVTVKYWTPDNADEVFVEETGRFRVTFLFTTEEDASRHSYGDCMDRRMTGNNNVRRWDEQGVLQRR